MDLSSNSLDETYGSLKKLWDESNYSQDLEEIMSRVHHGRRQSLDKAIFHSVAPVDHRDTRAMWELVAFHEVVEQLRNRNPSLEVYFHNHSDKTVDPPPGLGADRPSEIAQWLERKFHTSILDGRNHYEKCTPNSFLFALGFPYYKFLDMDGPPAMYIGSDFRNGIQLALPYVDSSDDDFNHAQIALETYRDIADQLFHGCEFANFPCDRTQESDDSSLQTGLELCGIWWRDERLQNEPLLLESTFSDHSTITGLQSPTSSSGSNSPVISNSTTGYDEISLEAGQEDEANSMASEAADLGEPAEPEESIESAEIVRRQVTLRPAERQLEDKLGTRVIEHKNPVEVHTHSYEQALRDLILMREPSYLGVLILLLLTFTLIYASVMYDLYREIHLRQDLWDFRERVYQITLQGSSQLKGSLGCAKQLCESGWTKLHSEDLRQDLRLLKAGFYEVLQHVLSLVRETITLLKLHYFEASYGMKGISCIVVLCVILLPHVKFLKELYGVAWYSAGWLYRNAGAFIMGVTYLVL